MQFQVILSKSVSAIVDFTIWRHIATGFAKFSRGKPHPTQIVVCKQLLRENSFKRQLLFKFVLYDSLTLIKSSGTFLNVSIAIILFGYFVKCES